ncbi:unnamed protein product [Peronospora belbahrii]|uniref:Uncharacterized protein n=1 Tax=Peronospora belbahrii TaxID=622444 RepID=A0AAU9KP11_9STRA|nr:unnamed protein product [Peronospora belbahrii]
MIQNLSDDPDENDQVQDEEEMDMKSVAYDGRAVVDMLESTRRRARSFNTSYVIHFELIQWRRDQQGMWSQIIKCIAHVLPECDVMSGQFMAIQDIEEKAQEFRLQLRTRRVKILKDPMYPLTPGRYILQGITIAENAFVYECIVDMILHVNGTMSGTSCEFPFTQECPLTGMWTCNGLKYLLQYEMHGNNHTYIYLLWHTNLLELARHVAKFQACRTCTKP